MAEQENPSGPRLSLKPSLLVAVQISRVGGVTYARGAASEESGDNYEKKTWETTKEIPNVAEFKTAEAAAAECRRLISAICYRTSFGLLCSKDREKELTEAVKVVKAKIADVNSALQTVRLTASVIRAEISSSDQEAAQAVVQEIGGFLAELTSAVEACDVKKIRQTVGAVKGIESLLPEIQSQSLRSAIAAAKKAASTIVKEVQKKERTIDEVRRELDLSPIDAARMMFVEPDAGTAPAPAGFVAMSDPEAAKELAGIEA
jgi:hypothetical protein